MQGTTTTDNKTQPVVFFKKRDRSKYHKQNVEPAITLSDSENLSEDEIERGPKRPKRNIGCLSASVKTKTPPIADIQPTKSTADRTTIKNYCDATKSSDWYDEVSADMISTGNSTESTRTKHINLSDGNYKGLANISNFITKDINAPKRVFGPIKAPTNLRTITVTDFAPDVCKDYKQTGFCGFGDSCKYLHAREDYKHGWQLDREWENVTKGKQMIGGVTIASANRMMVDEESEEDGKLENVPFACIICKEDYRDPIMTKCRHYFCESCALKRYKKYQSCAACGAATGGVFNVAKNLVKLLLRKQERALKKNKASENEE